MRIRNLQTIQFKIVEALDVPTISKSVKSQLIKDVQEHYTHLVDIQLADSNATNSDTNIDALIGANLSQKKLDKALWDPQLSNQFSGGCLVVHMKLTLGQLQQIL